jgi:hypothetical protein
MIISQQSERLDPTEVDSNVVLVWSAHTLVWQRGELTPGTLIKSKEASQATCAMTAPAHRLTCRLPRDVPFEGEPTEDVPL